MHPSIDSSVSVNRRNCWSTMGRHRSGVEGTRSGVGRGLEVRTWPTTRLNRLDLFDNSQTARKFECGEIISLSFRGWKRFRRGRQTCGMGYRLVMEFVIYVAVANMLVCFVCVCILSEWGSSDRRGVSPPGHPGSIDPFRGPLCLHFHSPSSWLETKDMCFWSLSRPLYKYTVLCLCLYVYILHVIVHVGLYSHIFTFCVPMFLC